MTADPCPRCGGSMWRLHVHGLCEFCEKIGTCDHDLIATIAQRLCQYNRVIRSMPSAEEIARATPYARSLLKTIDTVRKMEK